MEENRCETVAGKVVKTRVDYWRVSRSAPRSCVFLHQYREYLEPSFDEALERMVSSSPLFAAANNEPQLAVSKSRLPRGYPLMPRTPDHGSILDHPERVQRYELAFFPLSPFDDAAESHRDDDAASSPSTSRVSVSWRA